MCGGQVANCCMIAENATSRFTAGLDLNRGVCISLSEHGAVAPMIGVGQAAGKLRGAPQRCSPSTATARVTQGHLWHQGSDLALYGVVSWGDTVRSGTGPAFPAPIGAPTMCPGYCRPAQRPGGMPTNPAISPNR